MIIHVSKSPESMPDGMITVSRPEEAILLLRKFAGSCSNNNNCKNGNRCDDRDGGEKKIVIHEGIYYGTHMELTREDSGLIIEGVGSTPPVLSGGVIPDRWRIAAGTGWFCTAAPLADGKCVDFRLLLTADGRYLKKARYPLEGSFKHLTRFDSSSWLGSAFNGWQRPLLPEEVDRIEYNPVDIPDNLDICSAEVQVYHSWNESYCRIMRHDKEKHMFYLDPPCGHPPGAWKQSYAIYNTAEGMTEEGRWFCDRTNNIVYYKPYKNEHVEDFSCIIPVTSRVIDMRGCRDVTIRGLSITAATTPVVNEQYIHPCRRGGCGFCVMEQDGSITGADIENLLVEDISIYKTGGYGLILRGEGIRVRGSHISHCGAGGIGISCSRTFKPGAAVKPENHSVLPAVENCCIEWTGLDYYSGAGIFCDNVILRDNLITNTTYSGIVANGDNMLVEGNIVINPMLELEDGAAIYLHINGGSTVRNNYCENRNLLRKDTNLVIGIYLDVMTRNFEVCGNIVKGFKFALINHKGQEHNVWHDNYFEYDGEMTISFVRSEPTDLIKNIFKCASLVFRSPAKGIGIIDGNIFLMAEKLIEWRETSDEGYSVIKIHEYNPGGTNKIICQMKQ